MPEPQKIEASLQFNRTPEDGAIYSPENPSDTDSLYNKMARMEANLKELTVWLRKVFGAVNSATAKQCPNCSESDSFVVVVRRCTNCNFRGDSPIVKSRSRR